MPLEPPRAGIIAKILMEILLRESDWFYFRIRKHESHTGDMVKP